jgi:hypothetical protein
VSRIGKRDHRKAGQSDLVPFIAGETEDERHARRLKVNLAAFKEAKKEAAKRGLSIQTFHDGHHWKFTKPEFLAEWWPSWPDWTAWQKTYAKDGRLLEVLPYT